MMVMKLMIVMEILLMVLIKELFKGEEVLIIDANMLLNLYKNYILSIKEELVINLHLLINESNPIQLYTCLLQ